MRKAKRLADRPVLFAYQRRSPESGVHDQHRGFRCENSEGANECRPAASLCSDDEQLLDELHLRHRVALCHPPHPSFSDHVHGFDSSQCSPRRPHGSVPLGKPSVIVLHNVIEMFALPQTATSSDGAILFQVLNGRWICAVLIDVDHPGRRLPGCAKALRKKRFAAAASRLEVRRKSMVCLWNRPRDRGIAPGLSP